MQHDRSETTDLDDDDFEDGVVAYLEAEFPEAVQLIRRREQKAAALDPPKLAVALHESGVIDISLTRLAEDVAAEYARLSDEDRDHWRQHAGALHEEAER